MMLGAIGSIVSGIGQASAMGAQSSMASYQAQVAKMNERIMKQNASMSILAGMSQQEQKGLETGALLGTQKAAQAANQIDVETGSAKSIRDSTYMLGRMDEMTIMRNATTKADAYMASAANYAAEANLYNMQAEAYDTAKMFAMASSLIGGASSFADKWKTSQAAGMAPI